MNCLNISVLFPNIVTALAASLPPQIHKISWNEFQNNQIIPWWTKTVLISFLHPEHFLLPLWQIFLYKKILHLTHDCRWHSESFAINFFPRKKKKKKHLIKPDLYKACSCNSRYIKKMLPLIFPSASVGPPPVRTIRLTPYNKHNAA